MKLLNQKLPNDQNLFSFFFRQNCINWFSRKAVTFYTEQCTARWFINSKTILDPPLGLRGNQDTNSFINPIVILQTDPSHVLCSAYCAKPHPLFVSSKFLTTYILYASCTSCVPPLKSLPLLLIWVNIVLFIHFPPWLLKLFYLLHLLLWRSFLLNNGLLCSVKLAPHMLYAYNYYSYKFCIPVQLFHSVWL